MACKMGKVVPCRPDEKIDRKSDDHGSSSCQFLNSKARRCFGHAADSTSWKGWRYIHGQTYLRKVHSRSQHELPLAAATTVSSQTAATPPVSCLLSEELPSWIEQENRRQFVEPKRQASQTWEGILRAERLTTLHTSASEPKRPSAPPLSSQLPKLQECVGTTTASLRPPCALASPNKADAVLSAHVRPRKLEAKSMQC